ncbi:MAG: ribosome biogenesis GTP-binding protein YihA/YsxC [Alphaproteobacteria bacterium]|nr:ribosome biogenesis GTP-binding protein YihA/YsxC [Alphaproteobacteria bacterium]
MIEDEDVRRLFAQPCKFVLAAAAPEQFPATANAPLEVALIGRSNVGKSSLINALTGRKSLARTSNTPGRTQQIVFFDLAQRLMLVDLPGYGHASAPTTMSEKWNSLVRYYIQTRPNLRLVCLLLDSRHGALANDIDMMNFLDRAAISYQIIMTKADQLRAAERDNKAHQVEAMLSKHPAARAKIISTSAEKLVGLQEVQQAIAAFALPEKTKTR